MEVGVAEAKDRLSELIGRAEAGEVVTITRHGRPAVTLNAATPPVTAERIEGFIRALAPYRGGMPRLSDEEIVHAVHSGRKY